jgi:hypothetical protein
MGEGWLGGRDGMGAEVARRHTCNRSVEDVEDVPAPRGLEVERGCGPLSPAPWTHASATVSVDQYPTLTGAAHGVGAWHCPALGSQMEGSTFVKCTPFTSKKQRRALKAWEISGSRLRRSGS